MLILVSGITYRSLLIILLLFLFIAPVFANNLYKENASVLVWQGSYIRIDQVGTRQSGEKITITATTDLPVGSPVLFEVLLTPVSPAQKSQVGAFSGATGTATVYSGRDSNHNLLSYPVDLSAFLQGDYHVLASSANSAVTGSGQFSVVPAITKKPPLPAFIFSPSPAIVDQTVVFDGSGSTDPDGKIITYQWDFGDGSPLISSTSSPGDVHSSHTYRSAGNYMAGLKVMDNSEQAAWAYNEVRVLDPVLPVADFTLSPVRGLAWENHPLAVSLSDQSTGSPREWAWYIDNTLVSQMRTYSQSIFTKPGNYTIKLVVTNDYGSSAKEKQVTVLPFQTTTTTVARTTISQTQTITDIPAQPATTITPVPTTPVPQCLACGSPCVLFTIPCSWIDLLIIIIIGMFVLWYILKHWSPKRRQNTDSPEIPGQTGDKGLPPPEVTIITRGGISSRGPEVNNLDIHMDVEAGIRYHDKEE